LLFICHRDRRALHPLPTRRSSDLFVFPQRQFMVFRGTKVEVHIATVINMAVILLRADKRRLWEESPVIVAARIFFAVGLPGDIRSEEHTSELQSRFDLVCRLLLEK